MARISVPPQRFFRSKRFCISDLTTFSFAQFQSHVAAGSAAGIAVHFNSVSSREKSSVRSDV